MSKQENPNELIGAGKHLLLKRRNGWEYVERRQVSGIVGILAVTEDRKLLLVEQYRPALDKRVIEIPAGLAGDLEGTENEAFAEAARRELLEETGYEAREMEYLTEGPASAGLSTEVITFFRARNLRKVAVGGGDTSEKITVHEVPLDTLNTWLAEKRRRGCAVDYKVYTALYFEGLANQR